MVDWYLSIVLGDRMQVVNHLRFPS